MGAAQRTLYTTRPPVGRGRPGGLQSVGRGRVIASDPARWGRHQFPSPRSPPSQLQSPQSPPSLSSTAVLLPTPQPIPPSTAPRPHSQGEESRKGTIPLSASSSKSRIFRPRCGLPFSRWRSRSQLPQSLLPRPSCPLRPRASWYLAGSVRGTCDSDSRVVSLSPT